MADFLLNTGIAVGLILFVLLGWTRVQKLARTFAARHPEFGPAREEGGGCGGNCACGAGQCSASQKIPFETHHQELDT